MVDVKAEGAEEGTAKPEAVTDAEGTAEQKGGEDGVEAVGEAAAAQEGGKAAEEAPAAAEAEAEAGGEGEGEEAPARGEEGEGKESKEEVDEGEAVDEEPTIFEGSSFATVKLAVVEAINEYVLTQLGQDESIRSGPNSSLPTQRNATLLSQPTGRERRKTSKS